MIPTVRVANPRTQTGYMTINASDYRELVHGPLWHEQEPGFTGQLPMPQSATAYSPEEQRKAAALLFEMFEIDSELNGSVSYASLNAAARLEYLDAKRAEVQEARARYVRRMDPPAPQPEPTAPSAAGDQAAGDQAAGDQAAGDGPVPGSIAGWPIDKATGKPMHLTPAQVAVLQQVNREQAEIGDAPGAVQQSQAGAADEPPAPPAPPKPPAPPPAADSPSWLSPKPPATPVAETAVRSVEKGPGGKWYVMQCGKPVSEGHKLKGDAEVAAQKLAEADAAAARQE